ncbi:hypothetical protein SCLCIDRAFT_1223130 [Scleroderma citrinum Foug A]|uniref:Uncharacterized protein n=1 Tax=Scleroderma citrinum Foug A TaxID=1036808 RepID=A0A0C3D9T2_9AGAM|nr:hypothetical protein SCLCIDRAFT_1223130 [Scleroderma citrinum Foug A]
MVRESRLCDVCTHDSILLYAEAPRRRSGSSHARRATHSLTLKFSVDSGEPHVNGNLVRVEGPSLLPRNVLCTFCGASNQQTGAGM